MDARRLRLPARRGRGRNSAKPDRIRAGGVAAVRSFIARGGLRRRVINGLLGVESARARAGDRDAGAAIPVAAQRDFAIIGTAWSAGRGTEGQRDGEKEGQRDRGTERRRDCPSLSIALSLPLSVSPSLCLIWS